MLKQSLDLTAILRPTNNTLLHFAAWNGKPGAMKMLLATGAFGDRLEAYNKQGQTAMHVASFRSPLPVVEM